MEPALERPGGPQDGRDASSRFLWPPTIYTSAFLVSAALAWLAPIGWPIAPWLSRPIGAALIAAGALVALAAEWRFFRAGTATLPTRPTSVIVEDGIYRYSRNPMYLGMTLALLGCGFWAGSAWFALATPVAVIAVTRLAIEREERYLAAKFGAPYQSYQSRVRRWL